MKWQGITPTRPARGGRSKSICGSTERKVRIVLAAPDEPVEHVVHELRQRKQRHQDQLECSNFPRRTEQPASVLPHASVPKHLFDVSDRPKTNEKYRRSVSEDSKRASPTGLLHAGTAVPIDQREVRHSVNDDIGHREGVVRVETDDAGIPTHRGGRDDNILPGITFSFHEPAVKRLRSVSR